MKEEPLAPRENPAMDGEDVGRARERRLRAERLITARFRPYGTAVSSRESTGQSAGDVKNAENL